MRTTLTVTIDSKIHKKAMAFSKKERKGFISQLVEDALKDYIDSKEVKDGRHN